MKSNSTCCGGTTTTCDNLIAELPRYYPRQLITPDDLTLEQNYFRDRMRRHNRLLHGWGVVCGALVCPVAVTASDGTVSYAPWQVQVQRGYALGPYGDEILLDCSRTVDLRTSGVSGAAGDPCLDVPDPWCTQVFTPPSTSSKLFIAVKYKQSMTRPVRVQPAGCVCDDSSCEYSRWHDGYEIGVLQKCPDCNEAPATGAPSDPGQQTKGNIPGCPDCACGPWVGLAVVTLNPDGSIAQIDNCSCRRIVFSLANYWWQCTDSLTVTGVTDANNDPNPIIVPTDGSALDVIVKGTSLDIAAKYNFGPGVTATAQPVTSGPTTGLSKVTLSVSAKNAASGIRPLTVVNPDCSTAIFPNAINIPATAAGKMTNLSTTRTPGGTLAPAGGAKNPRTKRSNPI